LRTQSARQRLRRSCSASPERLAKTLADAGVTEVDRFDNVPQAVQSARAQAGPNDLVLVTGSFYTVGDARPLFVRA
jgi:folylpolyglutamate synthase/dihydropteroate synthase